jgi:uncharacterized protein (TIRG00374 family)
VSKTNEDAQPPPKASPAAQVAGAGQQASNGEHSAPESSDAEQPASSMLGRRLAMGTVFGLLVYAAMLLWADIGAIQTALVDFNWMLIPIACGLSFTNYVVRFARWERYRGLLGIRLDRVTSFLIYLSGLALTVTPGKMGEAFKSWLIRRVEGSPIHKTAPIVLAERFTDLLAFLVLVAIGGLATQPEYAWIFWATLGLCGVMLAVLMSASLASRCVALLARLPLIGKAAPKIEGALDSSRVLLTPRELPFATIVSTLGWGLECFAFWLIANELAGPEATEGIPLLFAMYSFALSAVAGAVLIIAPGGLGITEGTLSGLLGAKYRALSIAPEAARARAASATMVIRLCTLWFAVAVGLAAWWLFNKRQAAAERS